MNGDITFHAEKAIEGEFDSGLFWVDGDSGSWDGPSKDWLSHREVIFPLVKKFDVCVQAGGNLGLYPMMLSKRFTRVYTFEPHPLSFRCLMKNSMDRRNVYAFNAALSSSNQLCSMSMDFSYNMGMNRTDFDPGGYVPSFLVDQLALETCDLIWFDIEGAEPGAIEGSTQTITKHRPIVVLETTNGYVTKFLENLNYEYVGRTISDNVFAPKSI